MLKPKAHGVLAQTIAVFMAGVETVTFAPMLCVLFLGTRIRALQLATAEDGSVPKEAGPPPWAQHAMFLASWSIIIQLVLAMLTVVVFKQDDGTRRAPPKGPTRTIG